MNTIYANRGQSVFDIAIQEYGSMDGLARLMEDNETIMEKNDLEGVAISIRDAVIDQRVVDFFASRTRKIISE